MPHRLGGRPRPPRRRGVRAVLSGSAPPDEARARRLDESDPLARFRDRFVVTDPGVVYLDGNSLGRAPLAALDALAHTAAVEWAGGLVESWQRWIDLPEVVGDRLATAVLGARSGEVVVCDQTSVNLYKLASAALGARPDRSVIVTDPGNFPSDRYVLSAIAAAAGGTVREAAATPEAVAAVVDGDVALVSLSHVDYRTGALADLAGITAAAHDAGALVLWDVSHTAGVVPIDLTAAGVDLAVGCTYKYLNGGPGAPAFLFVRTDLQEELSSPIPGWFGHAAQFAFEPGYRPAAGIARFLAGTPPVLSLAAAAAGIEIVAEAGAAAIRAKSLALTSFLIECFDLHLAGRGFSLVTPRADEARGGHVALAHPDAGRICRALIERHRVIADFRTPDIIRLGPAPLYTTFAEVLEAVRRLASLIDGDTHLDLATPHPRVT